MLVTQKHQQSVTANWFTVLVVLMLCSRFGVPAIIGLLTKLYEYFIQRVSLLI